MPSNQRLDPLGIYGTRSAARQQAARRRRRWQQYFLIVLGIVGVAAFISLIRHPPSPSSPVDWGQKLPIRPASAPAFTSSGGLLLPTASGQVRLLAAPSNSETPNQSPAALAGNVVYASAFPLQATPLLDAERAYLPGQDGVLAAINWRTQKVLWEHGTEGALTASPVSVSVPAFANVPARQVVVGGNDTGEVFALASGNGQQVWSTQLAAPVGQGIAKGFTGLPTGERVPLIMVPVGTGLAARGGLVCLDARDGRVRWKFPPDGRIFASTIAAPALQTGSDGLVHRIYFGTDNGIVYALDPVTGRDLPSEGRSKLGWRTALSPKLGSASKTLVSLRGAATWIPSLNIVVVGGNDGGVRALDGDSGRLLWTFWAQGPVLTKARLVTTQGQTGILVTDGGGYAYTLNPTDGRSQRKWRLFGGTPAIWADVSQDGRQVLLLDANANLQGIRL